MTSTSKILRTLYTLVLVLRQTHQRTLRLIIALVKLQALLSDCLQGFGVPTLLPAPTGLTTMYTTISQRRFHWIGNVLRMSDERIPKDVLCSELVVGKRNVGRPRLRYEDVCKRDLKSLNVDIDEWEKLTEDRNKWRSLIRKRLR